MTDKTEKGGIDVRYKKLKEMVDRYRYLYHVLDNPEVSDEVYDSLIEELGAIEKKYPNLLTNDSPTQRVGGEPLDEFSKIKHVVRQWSFDDVFNSEELVKWQEKIYRAAEKENISLNKINYCCELKIDGLKIILTYKKGILLTAATRGDGSIGEDVTNNIKTISSVPLKLTKEVDLIAVGEVWLSKSELERINKERIANDEQVFANTRNAAAGSIRQLDPKITASRRLSTFVYDIDQLVGLPMPESQEGELKLLKELGFEANPYYAVCKNLSEVEKYYKHWTKNKDRQEYGLDGVVLKINSREIQKKLGYTAKSPRWGVAYKFPAEQVTTVVEDIILQVGRTGVITPVAKLRPVTVAGSLVSRATLHNEDEIRRLDVRIGDTVVLQKAGDVIPDIVSVIKEMRTSKEKPYVFPKTLMACGGDGRIEKIPGQVAYRCVDKNSFAQLKRKFYHFVSKKAFNMDGLGPKIIDVLLDNGLVSNFADIFILKKGDLLALPRFGEKSVENVFTSIEKAKKISLARFIVSLSIPQVGEETAIDLALHFGTIGKVRQANFEDLQKIEGVGDVVAQEVVSWFANKDNSKLVDSLLKYIEIEKASSLSMKNGKLSGQSFVLTGTLSSMSRDEAKDKIRALGGDISESVSTKTTYLVAGDSAGSKLEKAQKLGVKVLSEEDFLKLVK